MAFVRLIATAHNLNSYKKTLVEEKQTSIEYRATGKRKFKFRWIAVKIRGKLRRIKQRIGYCFCGKKLCFNLRHVGSVENYVLKSLLGFLGGLMLTYIFFMIFVFQLKVKISIATVICSILGCVLVNGLAFSTKIRCIVFLTLPNFFSKKGRELLVAYAIALVLSGPGQNILDNLGILSDSLACGQEQLKSCLKQIFEVIKKPFYAIKDAIKKVIATVKLVIKKIKEILIKIKRIIMAIVRVIKAAFMFLMKIINICNKQLGTPFERCSRVFDNAIADCNAKLGAMFGWMCSITYIVKSVCYLVKIFDLVCIIVDFISNSIIGVVIRKVKGFIRHIRTMFYVRIKFSHSFHYESKASKSVDEISKEITNEIKQRVNAATEVFRLTYVAAGMFLIIMIAKVLIYRYRFLTKDSYENKYITEDFFQLEIQRAKHNRETVLPLNQKEAKLYVKLKSTKLTDVESKKLRKAIMNLVTITLKAAIYMACDYGLFWIMEMIKYYGRFQSKVQAPNIPLPHISGKGLLADLLGSIVRAFQPMGLTLEIDTVPCLPTPIPPDYDKYLEIATLIILCWVMTILEPYGLRFRVYIMTVYHPIRGKQRTIWLYNKILRKRTSFLKFARRQLRRKLFGSKGIEKVTLKEFLSAHFKIFAFCFDQSQTACLLCGKIFRENDSEKPIRCATPECAGTYCDECFGNLRNLCTVCLSPIEYGDMSDLSEEKDSSEDEPPKLIKKKRTFKWKRFLSPCCKKKAEKTLSDEEIPLYSSSKTSQQSLNDIRKSSKEDESEEDDTSEKRDEKNTQEMYGKDVKGSTDEEDMEEDENEESDSGNASSVSTDYSYSYQYNKEDSNVDLPETSKKDVEKQEILDYASMDSFREDNYDEEHDQFETEKSSRTGGEEQPSKDTLKDKDTLSDKASLRTQVVGRDSDENISRYPDKSVGEEIPLKQDRSSQIPTEKRESKQQQTSIVIIQCPYYRVDAETSISGENIKSQKNKRIDFVGVSDTSNDKPRRKVKKKRKAAVSEEGIEYWEKTSMVAIPKSTVSLSAKGKRKRRIKSLPAEEENTTDSQSHSSSSELRSLIEPKDRSIAKREESQAGTSGAYKEEEKMTGRKKSKFKMFIKRIIPKYKLHQEK